MHLWAERFDRDAGDFFALRLEAIADLPASSMPIVVPRRRRAAGIAIAAVAGAALVLAVGAWWLSPATNSLGIRRW